MTAEMTATSPHSSQNKNDSHSSGSRQTSKAHANSRSAKISGPDHCMVINLDDIGQCSSSQTSPKPEQVIQKHRGSEFLGWIATAPLAMTSFAWALKQIHGLNDLSPAMGMISNSNVMLSSQLWYFAILFAEYNMKVSPTVNTLIEADYVYGTHDKIAHIKQSEAVRLETHMACRKETSKGSRKIEGIDEGGHEIIWQGKTAFPIGCIIDATDTSGKLLSHKAVVLESSSRMEFVDEKTKLAFESHVTAFEGEHMSRGTSYELWHTLTIAGICDGEQRLTFANLCSLPLYASLTGYYISSLFGLTLLFRLFFSLWTPVKRVTFVKHISNNWPGSSPNPIADKYPSMRFDY